MNDESNIIASSLQVRILVSDIIQKTIYCPLENFFDETEPLSNLRLSSLDRMEILSKLEDVFDVEISMDAFNKNGSMKDLVDYICKLKNINTDI